MKIRTVLLVSLASMFALAAFVGFVVFGATSRVARLDAQRRQIVEAEKRILEMNVLAHSHLMWREGRAKRQWYAEYARLEDLLRSPALDEPPAKDAIAGLRGDAERLRAAFEELDQVGSLPVQDAVIERQLMDELLERSQRMATVADGLGARALQERLRARAAADRLVLGLLVTLAAASCAAVTIIRRRVVGPIARLQRGAEIVGKGNLDHRIGSISDDEIGELARAFDQMTAKLKRSRDTLEEKVEERTREIKELGKKNEIMLRSIGDGIIAIDKEWTITLWNPTAAKITGWSKDEALGQPFRRVVRLFRRVERTENVLFISDAMLEGKVHFMADDTILIRKDGTEIDVADSAAPIIDDQGSVTGVIIALRDNTKEKALDRSKNDLVSLVTHELRGPATIIRGYLELYGERWGKGLDGDQRDYLTKIAAANDKIVELGNSLLSVFRVDFGETIVTPEPADVREIGDEVLARQTLAVSRKHLQLERRYEPDIPTVNVDRKLTELAFSNLVSNAVKYSREGGEVVVEIRKVGKELVIAVIDHGVGIPKGETSKIFSKFYRATNVRSMEGVGVGLHVLKATLERAGCRLWFESEEGVGSTFFVAIPLTGMSRSGVVAGT